MNKNIKIILNKFLGPLVFLLLSWFIYRQIIHQPDWRGSLRQIKEALLGPLQGQLWLAVVLMPLNWGIEARKWQLALRPIGGIAFKNAFRAIFTGVTMASFTPNRMGEYLGRLLYIKEGHRVESISLTIVCSMAQLLVTLVVGLGGLVYIHYLLKSGLGAGSVAVPSTVFPGNSGASAVAAGYAATASPAAFHLAFWIDVLIGLVLFILVSLTILYFRFSAILRILGRVKSLERYLIRIKVLENFSPRLLLEILFLSFGRYLVFIVQYGLVFPVFGVNLHVGQLVGGMSVVFVVMAVVPTITLLTELGLRWEAGIQVMELFSANTVGILACSFTIWVVNLIIPALIGSLLMLSIKLFKK